jgi:hypothetical protein
MNNDNRFGYVLNDKFLLWELAGGKCQICEKALPWVGIRGGNDVQFDHSHVSGKARGVLCGKCNRNVEWYEQVAKRVESYVL